MVNSMASSDSFDQQDMYPSDYEEQVEIEEITEAQMLALMAQEQDPLETCRILFKSNPPNDGILPLSNCIELYNQGFTVLDGLFAQQDLEAALEQGTGFVKSEAKSMHYVPASSFRPDDDPFRDRNARNDVITFIKPETTQGGLLNILSRLNQVQLNLNQWIHFNGSAEYQLACYQGNGGKYDVNYKMTIRRIEMRFQYLH